ncbi:MAG: FIST C-terminal domain-containing protein [Synechococcales cyanobacterium]
MYWVNALSTQASLESALQEVVEQAQWQLRQKMSRPLVAVSRVSGSLELPMADLAILFVSGAFASEYARVLPLLRPLLPVRVLIGCSGGGVIGNGLEIEQEPAISLTLAVLPDVQIHSFYLDPDSLPDMDASPTAWETVIGVSNQRKPHFVLFADGFSSSVTDLLPGLDFAYPQSTKVGGLASGGSQPRQNALFLNDYLYRSGTIGLALTGNILLESVVAQGCRPIGQPLRIADANNNVILSLDDRSPLPLVQDLVQSLSVAEQQLIRQSNALFVGIVTDAFKANPEPGDFLVRMIVGLDPRTGAIAVGDRVRPGQLIQFHVRDAKTSRDDLHWALHRYHQTHRDPPLGALLFSCLGRGEGLYQVPHHDTRMMQEILGDIPVAGFFCNGEIGPVGETTFLHGFTSVFGLFRPAY